MAYGRLGVGLRGGHGNGAKTRPQASNGMQLLDGGEFFQCRFNQLHSRFHVFVAGVETEAEANGGFRLVAGKSNGLE